MQFKAILSAAILASISWAIEFTSFPPAGLMVGQTVNLTWSGATAGTPVTILLRAGPSSNLQTVQIITSSATGNSYAWTPASTLQDGASYALQIVQGDQGNYTPQFSIQGGTAASVSMSQSLSQSQSQSQSQSSLLASVSSSASSVLSSVSSQVSAISSSVSASSAMITSSASMSSRAASTSTSSSARPTTSGATTNTNAAGTNVQSPLALIMGAVAAMVYFQ